MQKRNLLKKAICSLLSFMLAFSSLTALPALAAGEEDSVGESVLDPPHESIPEPTLTEPENTPGFVEEPTPAEPEDELDSVEENESEKETKSSEPEEAVSDLAVIEGGPSEPPEIMLFPEIEGNPDLEADPIEQEKGETRTDLSDIATEKGLDSEELIKAEYIEERQSHPVIFSHESAPVIVNENGIGLSTSGLNYLQANLMFSDAPAKEYVLEVQSLDNPRFLCGWQEVSDPRIFIEVTPAIDNFTVTLWIPFDFLEEQGIFLSKEDQITFNGQCYDLNEFDFPEEIKKMEPPKVEYSYNGISIDGNFEDWAGIDKVSMKNPNPSNPCGMQSAVIWDGDYIYICFHVDDGNANAVGAMGTHGNGQYAITTDLGNILLIQPAFNGNSVSIYGVTGALAAIDNFNWDPENGHTTEIAIPTSELPAYNDSISFGYYQTEPFLSGIMNLNPVQEGIKGSGNFACDGDFAEWEAYPHTLIEYDTAGQQDSKVDGGAALCVKDRILYGHVKTAHIDHLNENGSEFLSAIEIAFNGDLEFKDLPEKGNFYPKMVTMDGSATVNEGVNNPNGISTYRSSDIRETTPEPGPFFGEMKIRVNGKVDEMEFAIDLEKVAAYIGCDASKFQTIHARFGRIGDEWVQTAGVSTGPVFVLILCFAVLGGVPAMYCLRCLFKRNPRTISHPIPSHPLRLVAPARAITIPSGKSILS